MKKKAKVTGKPARVSVTEALYAALKGMVDNAAMVPPEYREAAYEALRRAEREVKVKGKAKK